MTTTQPVSPALAALAEECGVSTGYEDGQGVWHDASAETLRAVLAAMGVVKAPGAGGTGGDEEADATAGGPATDAADRASLEPMPACCRLPTSMPSRMPGCRSS
ncbi:hypothetical protein [Dietzia sp. NCCP-2495]|uniref:hypothetical protein n=1 Tax=Dietzia sp. NCCP-2495 TaxID=2934675 RepID=UPI00222E4901|nr:hypothetical protein [Dietzia sp. NCCP-2495]